MLEMPGAFPASRLGHSAVELHPTFHDPGCFGPVMKVGGLIEKTFFRDRC